METFMAKEIEVKFLQVNEDEVRQKLKECGATLIYPMRLMRRYTIKTPQMYSNDSLLRIRDEGDKTTMTYKQFNAQAIDGCEEVEITVSDFENTALLLQCIGLPLTSYQESKREKWMLNGAEVVIDEWPWVKPYIEIEAPTKELVYETAALLGFNWDNAVFGSAMRAYEAEYPLILKNNILLSDIKEAKFSHPVPDLLIKE